MQKNRTPQTLQDCTALEHRIKLETGWNRARIFVIVRLVVGLIIMRSVNLTKLSCQINPGVARSTNYRRLQKFFLQFTPRMDHFARLLASFLPDEPWILTMDRTNWKFGEKDINILMLAVAYKGIAIPLIWTLLPKRGNSNHEERITLMERFLELFGREKIAMLLADREFVGIQWVDWLCNEKIPFVIRIRNDARLKRNGRDKGIHARNHFRHLPLSQSHHLGLRFVYGRKLNVSGMRITGRDTHVIVISSGVEPEKAITHYARRWEIETLFGCLKSRGFDLEATHMSDPAKIGKLVGILGIAFVWAYQMGEWLNEIQPIKIKKHGRKAKSLFRHGLDYLGELLMHWFLPGNKKRLRHALGFLACT